MGKEGGAVGREVSSSVDGGETMQREQVGARGAAGLGRRSQRREKQFRGAGELAGNTRCRATAHSNHRVRGAFVALGERRCARALAECSQAVFSRVVAVNTQQISSAGGRAKSALGRQRMQHLLRCAEGGGAFPKARPRAGEQEGEGEGAAPHTYLNRLLKT